MKREDQKRERDPRRNQGEGDKESARRFNEAQQSFVRTERGQKAIDEAGAVDASEEQTLAEAEAAGRARTKGEDPTLHRRKRDS